MASGKDTQAQNLPASIDLAQAYNSKLIAEVWHMGRNVRRQWYVVLRRLAKTGHGIQPMGADFILTGQVAFDSLAELNS